MQEKVLLKAFNVFLRRKFLSTITAAPIYTKNGNFAVLVKSKVVLIYLELIHKYVLPSNGLTGISIGAQEYRSPNFTGYITPDNGNNPCNDNKNDRNLWIGLLILLAIIFIIIIIVLCI